MRPTYLVNKGNKSSVFILYKTKQGQKRQRKTESVWPSEINPKVNQLETKVIPLGPVWYYNSLS